MRTEREYWDQLAGDDPATMIRHGDWADSIEADLARLPVANTGDRVLDLGCGVGRLSVAYARRYQAIVYGVDVSPAMLARAESHPLVSYWVCDGRTILVRPPLEFAGAFSVLMFQHIPTDAQASYVAQVAERLQPGARFVFQTVIGTEDTFLSHQVSADDPARWCADAGLEVESAEWAGSGWLWITARRC